MTLRSIYGDMIYNDAHAGNPDQVYRLMGYDSEKREIKMGMLAEKTHPYIRDKVSMARKIKIIRWK